MHGGSSGLLPILFIGLAVAIVMAWYSSSIARAERAEKLRLRGDLSKESNEFSEFKKTRDRELLEVHESSSQAIAKKDFLIEGLTKILEQRKSQFPWLASAFADLGALAGERDAKFLESKKHPAKKAADEVREHALRRHEAEKKLRILNYRTEYSERLFPWIVDYVGDDVPDYAVDVSGSENETTDDPASNWLTKAEYERLSSTENIRKLSTTGPKERNQIGKSEEITSGMSGIFMRRWDMRSNSPAPLMDLRIWAAM